MKYRDSQILFSFSHFVVYSKSQRSDSGWQAQGKMMRVPRQLVVCGAMWLLAVLPRTSAVSMEASEGCRGGSCQSGDVNLHALAGGLWDVAPSSLLAEASAEASAESSPRRSSRSPALDGRGTYMTIKCKIKYN